MLKILLAISVITTSIYSFQLTNTEGNAVNMSSFQGKKILLVNISTGSPRVGQLAGLQQLQQQYQDSLVVIAFPSNSFGTETRTDAQIGTFCQTNYQTDFVITAKAPVKGIGVQPVYAWVADSTQNGILNGVIVGDFQKFLIDRNGEVIGIFSPALDPMDSIIQQAIIGQ